jgi:hypothetical protein
VPQRQWRFSAAGHSAERRLRENRGEAARWLAVEVLLGDPGALGDDELVNRLHSLQDRLEQVTRARYGVD